MEFDVLGPVRVTNASERLDVGGPKQRAVLAMLIARHGRSVAGEVLVQAVYGEDASPRRLRNIQTYVSILRSVLGDVVVRSGDGWSLDVDRAQIDAFRFEDAYESIRSSAAPIGDCAQSLRAALGLWRGSPYQDVEAHGFLEADRTRLEELRQAVLLARIDADLAAGRHAELIGELEGLLLEHPYSEQLRGQHMLALYRAGRQREALASYSSMRTRLVEELGIDPSSDLQQLERQILEHDPALDPPPTPSLGNLPVQTASFIGRTHELEGLVAAIRDSRLVTVTGVGGVGKTRLALAAAERSRPDCAGGVWLVELAAVADPELVDLTTAGALGIDESAGRTPRELLIDYLSTASSLLVLDNCEHVLGAVAELVDALLRSAPDTRVLATSRELLGVHGETVVGLSPMALPPPDHDLDADAVVGFDAVELFETRARAAHQRFRLDDENIDAVVEICRRLDGIPLAIELAALRTRAYPPDVLVDLLDERFRVLTGGARSALPRQQTLAATIEWSYLLLDGKEQTVFRRLSVFRGGWNHDAMPVAAGGDVGEADLVELLSSLVDKSLVVVDDGGVEPRYSMLETVRRFALDALEATNEAEVVRARHADHVEAFVVEVARQLVGSDDTVWLRRVDRDLDNVRQVLTWCLEHGREEQAVRIASVLWEYWAVVQRPMEGISWILRTRSAAGDVSDSLLARSLFAEAALHERSAGTDPEPLFTRSIEIFESLLEAGVDLDVVATYYPRALHLLSRLVGNNKYDESRANSIAEKQLAMAEMLGDERTATTARRNLERVGAGDYPTLRERADLARAARRFSDRDVAVMASGPLRDRIWSCVNRAILELELGEAETGAIWFRRSSEIHREAGLAFLADFDLKRMELWRFLGHADGADQELVRWDRRLVGHPEAITNPKHLSEIVSDRALVDVRLGRLDRSAIGWGIYDALTSELEPNFPPTLRAAQESARAAARDELGAEFESLVDHGRTMTTAEIVDHVSR